MGGCNLVWEFEGCDFFNSRASFCICFAMKKGVACGWSDTLCIREGVCQFSRPINYVFWTRISTILVYRYYLCIYGGSRGQRETFGRVTLRSLAFYLSH